MQPSYGGMKEKVPSGFKKYAIQNFTPEMMEVFSQMMGMVGPESFLSRLAGGDESMFAQLEKPALQQFTGMAGNLASKFSGMGQGARHSSGFGQEMTGAAQDFASQLQSQRMGLQRGAVEDMMKYMAMILGQKPYETGLVEKEKPWWQGAFEGFATGAGQGAGKAMFGGF